MRVPDSIVRHVFQPLWDRYEGSVRLQELGRLRRTQWDDPAEIRRRADQALRDICRHAAATSPFYRNRFAAAGIDPAQVGSITDLRDLPLLTKQDVRAASDRLLSSAYPQDGLVPARTGGSTGVALAVFCDRQGVERRNAAALRSDEWSGWRLGEPIAAVWGNPPVARTFKNRVRALLKDRIFYLDTMAINDESIAAFVADWRRVRPGLLYGHAHSLYILAEALQGSPARLRPRGIVATSMMLLDKERRLIESVFGAPVTNRYGCEEVSLIACECEQHDGMHLNLDHAIVEFLRDDGSPCGPGEDGRIVVTEFVNRGMPMIRYEVGDRGVPSDRVCRCGRGLPLMDKLTGRTADFLIHNDGSRVAGISIIENSLTRFPGIRQLQIVQTTRHDLEVNLVPDEGYGSGVEADLIAGLRRMLGDEITCRMNHVDEIPQEASGKYRFTICEVGDG